MVPSVFAVVTGIVGLFLVTIDGFYGFPRLAYRKDYCSRQNTVQCNPEKAETESTWRSGLILRDAPINLQSFDQSAASWESIDLESYLDKALENIQETIY